MKEILKSAEKLTSFQLQALVNDLEKLKEETLIKELKNNKQLIREGFLKEDWYRMPSHTINFWSNQAMPESEIDTPVSSLKSIPFLKKGTRFVCHFHNTITSTMENINNIPIKSWQTDDENPEHQLPYPQSDMWALKYLENIRDIPTQEELKKAELDDIIIRKHNK